jgi:protein-disulfide isomerase
MPNYGFLASFALVVIATGFLMRNHINEKISETEKNASSISNDLIKQYNSFPDLGAPNFPSIYKLNQNPNAPLKMVIFSDFECPACKALSEQVPLLISKYGNDLDISYYFYPLDQNCNPGMQRPLHQFACKAAYAAVCMPSADFFQVHEVLFKNQDKFESGFLDEYIKKNKLEACITKPETKDIVAKTLAAAGAYNVQSTPTWLLNGKKIEGVLPFDQMTLLLDGVLKQVKK